MQYNIIFPMLTGRDLRCEKTSRRHSSQRQKQGNCIRNSGNDTLPATVQTGRRDFLSPESCQGFYNNFGTRPRDHRRYWEKHSCLQGIGTIRQWSMSLTPLFSKTTSCHLCWIEPTKQKHFLTSYFECQRSLAQGVNVSHVGCVTVRGPCSQYTFTCSRK